MLARQPLEMGHRGEYDRYVAFNGRRPDQVPGVRDYQEGLS